MNSSKKIYIFFFLLITIVTYSQLPYKKEDLQKQSVQLKQEIAELNKALISSKNESKISIAYIANLDKKIKVRAKLISNTRKESRVLDEEIYLNQLAVNKLRRELKKLRENYADVLIRSYKNRSVQNKILFILSSENISQAFRRIKYLQKYSEFQDEKVAEINEKQQQILHTIELREAAKKEKLEVLAQQQSQINQLNVEKKEKEIVVQRYMKEQGDLAEKIKQKQTQQKVLEKQVQAIIAEELRIVKLKEAEEKRKAEELERLRKKTIEEERAKKAMEAQLAAQRIAEAKAAAAKKAAEEALAAKIAAQKEANDKAAAKRAEDARKAAEKAAAEKAVADKLAAKKAEDAKIAEEKAIEKKKSLELPNVNTSASETLSKDFESNKNSLPWPVSGTVVSGFGRTPHPVVPNIYVEHQGIEISAAPGSSAKAVFNGTVSRILIVPGGGKAVLISHGNYFTLYSNLSSVNVSVGDKIKTGQALGKIYTDDTNTTLLGFQVWKGTVPQNPANWLSGM
ncbi:murein hydrolase activator EnvC [Apibacter sp.]|uniref:murein hydrolase activator EnvC family protein n=1 Tax=Apibacter sp. TaxID=2023709 RepID=UPI0025D1CB6A|nr:M23 family metallopeptidase [Apibacter sp.]MCT6869223.1 peptidoglycan DD-metalloendopeptidase family protein [Apibacter sp.]